MCDFLHCRNNSRVRTHERGAILIMVLLIVALVAGLGIKFASQYQLGLSRAESRWHGAQARAFLEGTEEVAKLLFETADLDPNTDYLGEPWGNEVPIQDEGVNGVAKLTDAASQLSLNDLLEAIAADKPIGTAARYSSQQRRFIRLLQTFPDIPVGTQQAEQLMEAIVDWTDEDDAESGEGGAESNYYQSLPDPYLPPNAMFKTLDELRLVRGFNENPLLVTRLLNFITVLPARNVGINVNTMDVMSPLGEGTNNLLRSLNDENNLEPTSDQDAEQFIAGRPETGFPNPAEVTAAWNKQFSGRTLDSMGIQGKTDYFWLQASVQLVDQRRSIRSLMKRGEQNKLKVIQRDDMFELPTVVRVDQNKTKDDTKDKKDKKATD